MDPGAGMLFLLLGCGHDGTVERAQLTVDADLLELVDGSATFRVGNEGGVRLGIDIAVGEGFEATFLGVTPGNPPLWDDRRDSPVLPGSALALEPDAALEVEVSVLPNAPEDAWGAVVIETLAEPDGDNEPAQSRVYADSDNAWAAVFVHGEGGGLPEGPAAEEILGISLDHTALEVGDSVSASIGVAGRGLVPCGSGIAEETGKLRMSCIIDDDDGNQSWVFGEIKVYPEGALTGPITIE